MIRTASPHNTRGTSPALGTTTIESWEIPRRPPGNTVRVATEDAPVKGLSPKALSIFHRTSGNHRLRNDCVDSHYCLDSLFCL